MISNAARLVTRPRVIAAALLVLAALSPTASDARPDQEGDDGKTTEEKRDEVRERQGEVDVEVDVLDAHNDEVASALSRIAANVTTQAAQVEEAQRASAEADEDLTEATEAVTVAEGRVDELNAATDEFAVDSYMHPPEEDMFDALSADTISDATIKEAIIDIQADSDADVLDLLEEAQEDVEVERANKEDVAVEAEAARADAEDELGELEAAQAQQEAFVEEAEAALDQKLIEAANLAEIDKELSDQITAEQAARAALLAEAAKNRPPPPPPSSGGGGRGTITPAPGGVSRVSCSTGGSVEVAGSIAGNVRSMLDAAAAAGVGLCGWGYRNPQEQIELRKAHCGTSNYAIYEMPSSQCSPPTARPGRSMHEKGLAIDMTCNGGGSISSHGSPCFQWLDAHASNYGFYNLAVEPWHWSTTGN
jgi:peptidoglycan hydrolase CwlO-like protein